MNTPFFTVIIPTYNRAELLTEAIQSVLAQTYQNFEVIIVDDHSTDNTKEIVNSFKDERIKYLVNVRTKGAAGARNTGIFLANGEWVAFLDSDDIWLPEKLEKQHKQINSLNETTGFIYAGYAVYDFDNKLEIKKYMPEKEGWIQKDMLYANYVTALPSVAVRRDILAKVGGFDEQFEAMQDMDLYIRVAGISKIAFIRETLIYVRYSSVDRISMNFQKKLNASLLFEKKYFSLLKKNIRLRHRAASRIFLYSFKQRNKKYLLKSLPWTLIGILCDPINVVQVMRFTIASIVNNKQ